MVAHACAAIEVAESCRAVWHLKGDESRCHVGTRLLLTRPWPLSLYWRETTVQGTVRVEELPARSVAFTACSPVAIRDHPRCRR